MECKIKDIAFYYEEYGIGRPLLVLHGWGCDHRHMVNELEPAFTDRDGWRRIYPDLPGTGKTRGANWIAHQDQMLGVVLEFLDAVAPGERFTVAGTSYGGYLARGVVYCREAQIDGALLVVPSVERDTKKMNAPKHQVLKEDAEFLAALEPGEDWVREVIVAQSLGLLKEHRLTYQAAMADADQEFLKRLDPSSSFSFQVDALPAPFPAPALILTGRYDHWCGYREAYQILDNYPRGTFAILDRAGHGLALEQKTLFKALVSEWLDRVEEYALGNRD